MSNQRSSFYPMTKYFQIRVGNNRLVKNSQNLFIINRSKFVFLKCSNFQEYKYKWIERNCLNMKIALQFFNKINIQNMDMISETSVFKYFGIFHFFFHYKNQLKKCKLKEWNLEQGILYKGAICLYSVNIINQNPE